MASKSSITTTPLLAVVIPLFNEEKGVQKCITAVVNVLKKIPRTHLILVNDGSHDKTEEIIKTTIKRMKNKITLVTHKKNKGYGAALKSGVVKAATMKIPYVLFMDSDLTNHPRFILHFFTMIEKDYDCVKASRFIKGGKMLGVPLYRQVLSKLGNLVAVMCFRMGIRDCTNGFRMVKVAKVNSMPLKQNNFSIIVEELYYFKKQHASIIEIPSVLTARKESKSHFSYSFSLMKDYALFMLKACFI